MVKLLLLGFMDVKMFFYFKSHLTFPNLYSSKHFQANADWPQNILWQVHSVQQNQTPPSQSDTQSKQPTTTLITCGLYGLRKNRVHMINTTFFLCAHSNVTSTYVENFSTVKI